MKWAYGITTVPERRATYLPRTLASLKAAGFGEPRLFVDGDDDAKSWKSEFGLEVSCRYPRVKAHANWVLSLNELYLRDREHTHFLLFQDDVLTCRNLRRYLERCQLPERAYFNLYTMGGKWQERSEKRGWYPSNQKGRGALAVLLTRAGVMELLSARHMVDRFQNAQRGDVNVDGGISDSFRKAGWTEYVHNPSLVQHIGDESAIGHKKHPLAEDWMGEEWDVTCLLSS